jgi:hypothetical protein
LLVLGLALTTFGVAAELLGGTMFRRFFDPTYPPARVPHDDVRIKVRLARIGLIVGVLLLLLSLVRAVLL